MDVLVADGATIGGVTLRYDYQSYTGVGDLGDPIAEITPEPALLSVVDRGPVIDGWGASLVDSLMPIVSELVRRYSGLSKVLDTNESPIFAVFGNPADIVAFEDDTNPYASGGDLTAEQLRKWAPSLKQSEVTIFPQSIDRAEYLLWEGDMAASFAFIDRLEAEMSRASGMAPMGLESADTGDTPSGIAIARRQALLVTRTARLHAALHNAAQKAWGQPFAWPWVGDDLAGSDETVTDEAVGVEDGLA